jgi:precorrin-8X/cobalt-precorrin-8 methylmutase
VDPELIEANSYRILRSRIDLSRLPPFTRAVTERMIYMSADFDYATDLVADEDTLAAAVAALAAGAPVVADVAMVAAGITARPVICKIDDPLTRRLARVTGLAPAARAATCCCWTSRPTTWTWRRCPRWRTRCRSSPAAR